MQKVGDRNGRCLAILFKSIGVRGQFDSPEYWGLAQVLFLPVSGNCSGTPNPYNSSEKYWQYTSNLYRNTPPICNALPCWLLNFGGRETPQNTSNLYCSTPPICTTVRLPFVPGILLRKYQGLEVPESS